MSDDPSEALELIDNISRPQSLAPGIEMVPLSGVGIAIPPALLAKHRTLRDARWERLKHNDPAAIAEWERRGVAVAEYQKSLGSPTVAAFASAADDDEGISSRPILVRR